MARPTIAEVLAMDGPSFAVQGFPDHIIEEWVRNASEEQIIAAKRQCDISVMGRTRKVIEKEEEGIRQRRIADIANFSAMATANVSKNTEVVAASVSVPWWKSDAMKVGIICSIVSALAGVFLGMWIATATQSKDRTSQETPAGSPSAHTTTEGRP